VEVNLADAAPASSSASLGFVLCGGLCLLFSLSVLGLALLLVRNSRRKAKSEAEAEAEPDDRFPDGQQP
jgi:hypothetical protein